MSAKRASIFYNQRAVQLSQAYHFQMCGITERINLQSMCRRGLLWLEASSIPAFGLQVLSPFRQELPLRESLPENFIISKAILTG
jgi:hypothetical protein